MQLPIKIKTVEKSKEFSTVINKSTFIAQVFPISSEAEIKDLLSKSKKKYYDASHHCYAFKFADGLFRYTDAGEPNGSAGIRIMNAIEHFELSNVLVIVSRIFGGVKLGVGPLGKAYYQAAYNVIEKSNINTQQLFHSATIITDYQYVSSIKRIVSNHNSLVINSEFEEKVKLICLLISNEVEVIVKQISETSKQSATLVLQDELVYK